jgi:hypothetical protein
MVPRKINIRHTPNDKGTTIIANQDIPHNKLCIISVENKLNKGDMIGFTTSWNDDATIQQNRLTDDGGVHKSWATKFCMVAPYNGGS